MKTLILGLGNTILSDDGAGIHLANLIKKSCPHLDVIEASAAGFRVVDEIIGYERLILLDSIKTGEAEPGTFYKLDFSEFETTLHHTSPHDVSLFKAFEIMKQQGADLPSEIKIYAVEVTDTQSFSESCSKKVFTALPSIAEEIIKENNLRG